MPLLQEAPINRLTPFPCFITRDFWAISHYVLGSACCFPSNFTLGAHLSVMV